MVRGIKLESHRLSKFRRSAVRGSITLDSKLCVLKVLGRPIPCDLESKPEEHLQVLYVHNLNHGNNNSSNCTHTLYTIFCISVTLPRGTFRVQPPCFEKPVSQERAGLMAPGFQIPRSRVGKPLRIPSRKNCRCKICRWHLAESMEGLVQRTAGSVSVRARRTEQTLLEAGDTAGRT